VTGQQFEHVIEKANPGIHVVSTAAIHRQPDGNPGFSGAPVDYGAAHSTSSIAAMQRFV
jgi:hypothetical protein